MVVNESRSRVKRLGLLSGFMTIHSLALGVSHVTASWSLTKRRRDQGSEMTDEER